MISVDLPPGSGSPEAVRSFAACLAAATESTINEVPLPPTDLESALAHWRSWLAGRGLGLAPVARPRQFAWPGYWLAVTADEICALLFGTPPGVVLSPQDESLVGTPSRDLDIADGYLVASLDPRPARHPSPPPLLAGQVEALAIAGRAGEPMRTVPRARALAGRGLEGDRYAAKQGTFTPATDDLRGYDLTLIEAEAIDDLARVAGVGIDHPDARRNVVTRGIDLNALVGRRFRIGTAEAVGQRWCEPCAHLARLTDTRLLRGLIHRGGLRADIVAEGEIDVGSTIQTLD